MGNIDNLNEIIFYVLTVFYIPVIIIHTLNPFWITVCVLLNDKGSQSAAHVRSVSLVISMWNHMAY